MPGRKTIEVSEVQTCDQCSLPFGRGGIVRLVAGAPLHFCCYGCSFTHSLLGEKGEEGTASLFLIRLGFAAFLSMNIMILSWVIYDRQWITFGLEPEVIPYLEKLLFVTATPIMLFVGYPYIRIAVREIRTLRFSMDSLIALGSFAAYGFSTHQVFWGGGGIYFDTATMTLVLVTAGRYLEATAKVRTSNAIRRLMELQPDTARKIDNGTEILLPAEEIGCGDLIKILPGERIPLDGFITEGETSVNESVLTGESLPSHKGPGDAVFAATVNIEGVVVARVTATQRDTVHAQTVRLMEEAQKSRSPVQQQVDRISAIFIPVVIGIAALTFVGWALTASLDLALLRALTVLVVACPCALGIGTPLASAIALGRAAEEGVLIRSTATLEKLADAKVIAFDKTGTITKGELTVTEIWTRGDESEFLSALAGVEKNSEHVLSKAVVEYAERKGALPREARNVVVVPGKGICGEVRFDGTWKTIFVGNRALLEEGGYPIPSDGWFGTSGMQPAGGPTVQTLVYVGWDGGVQGWLGMRDVLRRNAREVVASLRSQGLRTLLLSGDLQEVTQSVARAVEVDEAWGRLLPREKVEKIRVLRECGTLLMVGDGINDAPSLAAADAGITLGSATDIAKESAEVTILGDHLERIPWLIGYARRTLGTIRWNLFWAFGYNAAGIALAVAGVLEPVFAALAMIGSSLFIIVNSRRLAGKSERA